MGSKSAIVHIMHQLLCFAFINTPQQYHIVVPFVQNISVQQELTSQSSQGLLVFVGSTRRVFTVLQKLLNIMIPGSVVNYIRICLNNHVADGKHMRRPV